MGCHADGLLSGRSIDYEQSFLRLQKFFEFFQFLNQRVIDFLATGRIEDIDVRWARRVRAADSRSSST